jgi:ankyrin repeat protein
MHGKYIFLFLLKFNHLFSIKWHGLDAIDILLRFGADVNIRCHTYGAIPLHYILVYCYSSDTIEELVQAGSNVLISTKHGETCLSYSVMQNDNYLLKILFNSLTDKTVDLSKLILLSCLHGKDNSLEYIIENNPNINLDETMDDGMTALMLACYYGHYSCVHLLLHRKVNVKTINQLDGKTSLHYAALNGQSECLLALLQELQTNQEDLKTIINLKDKKGKYVFSNIYETDGSR